MIGRYSHIAPRATLCGEVIAQDNVFVGAGATVIQGLSLGESCVVGAGATIVNSLDSRHVAYNARPEIYAI
jgi:carbonic anhydrase/acetyltransferase-like protein (isoleucine patch superfamily)